MATLKNTTITDGTQITPPIRSIWNRPVIKTTVDRITTTGSTQTWNTPTGVNYADILVVGGGGGGGYGHGAGGGGGTVIYRENVPVSGSYSITIGAGGAANTSDAVNNAGGSTTAFGVTATGGGAGANEATAVGAGAGNGGGGTYGFSSGATGTLPTASGWTVFGGNRGGTGGLGSNNYPCAGGAGAGMNGGNGGNGGSYQFGGGGGHGIMIDITGEPLYWGGGGGGVIYDTGGNAGAGGLGGGGGAAAVTGTAGNGGYFALNMGDHGQTGPNEGTQRGGAGGANTGGGGGGGANENLLGGAGGSGIVVIRYAKTLSDEDPRGLIAYNRELKDIETYDSTKYGWVISNPYKNFAGHNICFWSERLDNNNVWGHNNVTVLPKQTTAPDGVGLADKIVETTTNAGHYTRQQVSVAAYDLWCGSVWVKAAGRTKVRLSFSSYSLWEGGGGGETIFNLSTQTITPFSSTPTGYGIQDWGNGWYRIYLTLRNTGSATTSGFNVFIDNAAEQREYAGDGTSGLFVWGMQIEKGVLTPGAYVRTESGNSPVPGIINGYRIHSYTNVGTSTFTAAVSGVVDVLVVAGGGGGGANHAGGGGGGGVIYREMVPVIQGRQYQVTVGAGGVGSRNFNGPSGQPGANGGNSQFGSLVAIGGGGGGGRNDLNEVCPGQAGGSGGGGGGAQTPYPKNYVPGDGTEGQGFIGGRAIDIYGGGGGGAGGPGSPGIASAGQGHGGPGRMYTISGAPVWYGGGGGGSSGGVTYIGQGGIGGGGNGGTTIGVEGTAGTANTGGGGGGGGAGGTSGGSGGSGIVIVRYRYD